MIQKCISSDFLGRITTILSAKYNLLLITTFFLALSIRLIIAAQATASPVFHGLIIDSEIYSSLAVQILNGNILFEDSIFINPLYPFFIATIYSIFGKVLLPILCIQAIIDSLGCIVICLIAIRIFNNKVIGIVSALMYAVYGMAAFYTGILLSTTLIIFLELLVILLLLVGQDKEQVRFFFISGMMAGLLTLARPNSILFLLVLPIWFVAASKTILVTKKHIKGLTAVIIGFVIALLPMSLRNYKIGKTFVPYPAQGGINFYIGNNKNATGKFINIKGIVNTPIEQVKTSKYCAELESGKRLNSSQASRYWFSKGLRFIVDHPLNALLLYLKKFALFWRKEEIPLNFNYSFVKTFLPVFKIPFISFGVIAPCAIIGLLFCLRMKEALLINLFFFSYMLSVILFFVSARYRLPSVPFLVIYASYGIYQFIRIVSSRRMKNVAVVLLLFVLVLIGVNGNFQYFKPPVGDPSSHNNLGMVYCRQGLFQDAIEQFNKAIALNPEYGEAYNNLGVAYAGRGKFNEAIAQWQKALEFYPGSQAIRANITRAKKILSSSQRN
jgi:tetratricopeptide (TPR) repeat protein